MKSSSSLKVYVDDRIFGFSSTASTSSNQKNKNNIITKNDNISPENSPKRSGKALKISDGEGYTKNRADSSSSKDVNAPVLIQVDSSILEKEKESGSSVHIVLQPLSQLSPSKTEQKSDVKSSSSRSSKTPPENNPKNSSSSRIQERAINLGSGKGDDSSHHSHNQSHKSDTSSKKQSLYSSRSSSSSKSSSKKEPKETNKKPISKDYTYSYEKPTPEEKAKFAQINQQNLSPPSSPRNYSISKIPQVEIKPENKESAVQTPRRFAGRKSPNKGSRNTSPRRASPRKSSPRKDLSPQHLSPRKKKVLERIELLELQLADLQSTPVDSENIVSDILVDKHKTKQIKENPQANLVSEHVQTTNLGFMKPADAILTIQTPIIEEEPQIPTPPASPLSISNAVQMNLVRSQTTSIAPSEYDSDESYEYESDNSELADRRKHPQLKVDVPKQTRVKKHIRVPKESPKQTTKAQPRVQERARSPSPKKGESKAPEDKIYRKVRIEKPKKTNSPRQELNQNEQQFIVQERDIQIMSSSVTMNDSSIGELNPVRAKAYAQKHFKKYEDPEYAKAHGVPFKPAQNYQSRQSPKQSPKKQKESDKKKKDNDSCTLKVNIREATNIPTVPTYCVLFVDGNAANPIKTEVAEAANSRKVFDEEYSLKVKDLRKANLIVLVKKEDLIRGDKLLGSTKIRISDLPLNNSLDKWYPLTTDTGVHTEGRLHLVLKKSQKGFVSSSNSSISSVTTSTAEFNEMINKLSSHTTSDFVPTTTITSSPQESVSKSSSQTASSSSNSPPTNTKSEWESYDSQPKQESTKSKPESTKSKPESTKSKPESTKSKPESTKSKPESTKSKPESTKSKPESTKSKSKSTKLKPEYAKDSVKEKSKSISSKNSETKFAQQESTISSVADTSKSHLTKTSSVSTPSKKNITVQKSPRSESSSRTPQQSKGARSSVSGSSKSSPKGTMNSTKESLFDVSLFKENPNPGRQSSVVPDESENSLKLLSESSSSESELEVQERDIPIIEKETKKFSNQDKSKENKKVIKPQQPVKDQKDSKEVKKPSKDKKKITNDENKPTKEDKKSNRKEKKPIKIKKKSIKEEKKPTKEEKKSIKEEKKPTKEEKKQEIEEREVLKLEKKSLNDIKPVKEITKDNEDIKSASEETKSPKEEKERVEDVQSSQIEQSKQEEKKPDQGNKLKTITPSKVEQKQLNKATVHPEKRPMKVVVNKPVKEQNIPLKPEKESSSSAQNEVAEKLQEKPEELNQQIHEEVPEEKVQSDHAVPREVEINSINVNDIREIPENSELSESTATVTSDFPLSDSSSSSSSSEDDENKENKESALSKLLGLNSPREPNYRRPKAQITYHEEPQEYSSSDGYDASAPSLTPTNFPIPTIKRPEDNSQLSIQQLLQRQKINSSYKTIEEELSESSTDSENIEIDNVPIEMISDNEDDIARRIDMRFGKQVDTGNVDYNQGDNIMFNLGNVVQLIPEIPKKKKKSNKYYGSLDFDNSDDVQEREIALDLTRSKITKVNAKTKEPHGIVGDLGIMVSKKKAEARNDPNRLSASSSSIFPSNSAALSANTVPLSSEQSSGSGGLNERYIQAGDKLSDENEFYSGNLADNISGAGKRYTDIIKRSIVDAEIENNFSSNVDIHRKQKADLNRNMKFNDDNHAFNSNKPNDYLEREIELSEENSPSNEQSDASISDIEKKKGITKVIQKALKEDDNSNVFSSAVENQKPIRIKKIEATKEKFSSSSSSSSSEGEKVKGDSSSISNAVVKSIKKKIKFDDESNNFDSTSSFAEKPNKNQTKKPEQKTKTYNPEKQKTSKVQKGEKADFERDYDYNLSDSSSSAVENDKAPKTKQPVNDDTSSSSSSSKENEFVSDVNKPTRSITHSIKDDDNSNNFASELSEPKKLQPASKKSKSKKTVSSSSSSSDQEETNPSVITREIRITPINEEISSSSISDIPQEKKIQRKIVKKIKSDDESNNFSSVIEGEPAIISVQRGSPPRQQHVSSSSSSSSGIYTLKPQIVTRPDPTQVKPKYNISSDSSTSISDLNEEKKIQKTIVKKIHIDDESNDFESLLESNPIQPAVKKVPKKQVVASSSSSSSSDSQTDTISEAQKEKMKKKIGEKIHVYDVSNSFTSTASELLKKSSYSSDSENFNKGEEEPVTRSIKKLIPVSSSSSDESNLSDSSSRNKSKIKPVENGEIASEKSSSEKKIYKKPDQNELSESSSTTSSSHSKSVSTSISSVVKEEEGLENNILHCIINDENENSFTSTSRNENLFEYSLQKVSSDSSSSSSSSDEPKILMKKLPPVENSSESLKESEGRKSHHAKSSEVKEFFISDEEKSISSKKSNKSEPKKIISTPSSSSSSEDENRSINSTKSNKSHKSIDQEKGVYLGNSSLSSVVQPELEEQIEQCFKNDDLENSFTSIIDSKPPVQNREIFVKPLEETSSNEEKAKSSSSTQSSKSKSSRKPEPKLPESYTSSSEEEIDKKSASSRKSNKSANSQKSNKSKNTVKSETKVESSSSSEDDKKSVDSHKSNKSTSSHKSIYSKKSNQSDISNHSNKSRSSQFSDLKDEPANFPRSIEPQLGQDNQGRYVRDYDHNELLPSYSSTVSRSSSLSNPKLSESSSFDKYHKSISSKKSNPVEDRGVDIESSQVSELKSENTNLSKIAEPRLEEDIKETIARDLDNKEFMSSSSSSISRHSKCSKKSNKSNSHRKEGSPVSESKSDSTVLSRVTEPKLDEDIKESIAQDLDNNNFLSASSTSSSSSSASKKSAKSKSSSKSIPKQPISSSSSSSSSEKKSISSKKSNKSNQKTVQSSSSNDEKQKKAIQRDALLSSSDEKSSKSSSRLSEAKSPSTNISQYAKEEEPELDQQITNSIVKDFVPNDFSSSSSFSKKSETHSSSTSSSSDNLLPPRRSSEHKVEQPTQNGKQETVKQQKKLFSDNLSPPPPPRRNTKKEAEIPKAKEQAQQISSSSYSSSDYEKSSRTSTSTRLIGKPPLPSKLLISSKNIPLPRYDDSSSSSSSVSMTSISEIVKDESELEGNIEACLAVDEVVNDFSSVSFTSENLEPAKKRDIEIQEYEEEEEVPNIESFSSSSSIREKLFRNKKMKQNQHSLSSDAKSSSTVTSSSPTSKASSELEHKIDDVLVHDNGEHIFSSAASLKESSHISYTYTYEVEEEDIIEFERVTSESSEPISTRSKKSNKSNKSEMSKKSNRLEKKYSSSDSDSIPSRKSTKSEKSAKSNKKLVEFSSSEPESRKSAKESSKSKKSISYSIPPQKVSKRSIKLESESSSLSSSSKNNMINELSSISDAAKISSEIEQKLLLDDNENVFTSEIKESEKSETTSRFSSGFDSASESLGVPRRHSKSSSKVSTLSDDDSFSHSQSSKYSCGKNNEFSYDLDEENETAFLETPKHGSKELIRNETLESDSLDIPSPKKSNKQTPSSSTNLESSKSEKKTKKFTSDDNDKNMRLKLHSTSTSKSSSENDKVQQLSDIEPANIENRNVSNFDLSVSDSESLSEQYPNIKKSKNKIDSSSSQKKPSSDTQHKKQTDNKKNNHNQQKMTTSSSSSSTSVSSISGAKSLSSLNENGQKLLLNESSTSISSSYYDISSSSSLSQLLSPASIESPWKVTLTIGQCTNFKNYNSLTVLVKMRDANPHFHRGKVGKNKEMRFVISNSKAPFKVVLYDGKYEVASFDSQIDEVIMRQDHEEVLTMTPNGGVPSTPLLSLKIHVIHS